jgi:hypothetical protein
MQTPFNLSGPRQLLLVDQKEKEEVLKGLLSKRGTILVYNDQSPELSAVASMS